MSYSPLTNKYIPANPANYSKGRSGCKVLKITPHHMAGNCSIETCGSFWQNASRRASSNYGIGTDGRIGCYVDEENRSWCSSSAANDNQAITIEVANDGGAPDWHVSDKAIESLINLMVDICKRYGIKKMNFTGNANGNLTLHKYFTSTACPGPYLEGKMPWIADQINQRLEEPKPEWSDIETTTYEANGEINLYNIVTGEVVSTYKNGTEITVVQKTTWNGIEYVRTEWSKEKNLDNGFKLSDLKLPAPEPEPTPEPTPEPDPTVGILQKIIAFIQHIIDLITGKDKK